MRPHCRGAAALRLLAVPMLAGLAWSAAAADWSLECPRQLATAQSVAAPVPDGWTAVARTESAMQNAGTGAAIAGTSPPVSISVFDGPPAELADLVPDDPNARVQRWTFGKARTRDIYIVCNYADTRVKLTRAVPATVGMCTLAGGNGTGVVCR